MTPFIDSPLCPAPSFPALPCATGPPAPAYTERAPELLTLGLGLPG